MTLPNGDDFAINVIVHEHDMGGPAPTEGYDNRILYLAKALHAVAAEIEADHEGLHFCFGASQWNESLHA